MRSLYGYSLRKLGQAAGLSQQEILFLERGERVLTPELERKIKNGLYRLSEQDAAARNKKEAAKDAK